MHTLNAYVVTMNGAPILVGGTPGGHVQVQSNLQVLSNVIDAGLDVQRAIEAPRWQWHTDEGRTVVELESRAARVTHEGLAARGHAMRTIGPWAHGSSYQLLAADPVTGALHAGSDPRCDGHAAAI